MSDDNVMSKLGARGGRARAAKMSPGEREAAARTAATARWNPAPRATHEGTLGAGDIPCYVLGDNRRVLSQSGMVAALGMTHGSNPRLGGDRLSNFISGKVIQPFISPDVQARVSEPIRFITKAGSAALGYEATTLVELCDAVLRARAEGRLQTQQRHIAQRCEILIRAFAKVGIIALVDEATGYQYDRAKAELQKILEGYISEELRPWVRHFHSEFFKQAYRLHGWEFRPGGNKHPQYLGKFISTVIYEQLPPGVLEELRNRNPVTESGGRRHKHHQFLTEETGIKHLDKQLVEVTTLMKVSPNKRAFTDLFARAFPQKFKTIPLGLGV